MEKTWGIVKYPSLEIFRIWLENESGDLQRPFHYKLFCGSMNFGFLNLIKLLNERFLFDCSFEQLHFKPRKPDCDQPQWTRSTSGTAQGSSPFSCQQKSSHHQEKLCPDTQSFHLPVSGWNISLSIRYHWKSIKISYSSSMQLLKYVNCFLTHWGSETFSKAFLCDASGSSLNLSV